jgi:hypothetical protein
MQLRWQVLGYFLLRSLTIIGCWHVMRYQDFSEKAHQNASVRVRLKTREQTEHRNEREKQGQPEEMIDRACRFGCAGVKDESDNGYRE